MSAPDLTGIKSSSWGLVLDLGDKVPQAHLEALYNSVWDSPEFTGPAFKMGEINGLPRGAEGLMTLLSGDAALNGKCYTKIETDDLGYPPSWEVPLSFSLSAFGFEQNLPDNQLLSEFLLKKAQAFAELHPFRLGIIGELSCYYINADLFSEDWLDLHQGSVLALMLDKRHPFARQHPGAEFTEGLYLYERAALAPFASADDEHTRYLRFKQRIARDLHAPRLGLEWERPNDN